MRGGTSAHLAPPWREADVFQTGSIQRIDGPPAFSAEKQSRGRQGCLSVGQQNHTHTAAHHNAIVTAITHINQSIDGNTFKWRPTIRWYSTRNAHGLVSARYILCAEAIQTQPTTLSYPCIRFKALTLSRFTSFFGLNKSSVVTTRGVSITTGGRPGGGDTEVLTRNEAACTIHTHM